MPSTGLQKCHRVLCACSFVPLLLGVKQVVRQDDETVRWSNAEMEVGWMGSATLCYLVRKFSDDINPFNNALSYDWRVFLLLILCTPTKLLLARWSGTLRLSPSLSSPSSPSPASPSSPGDQNGRSNGRAASGDSSKAKCWAHLGWVQVNGLHTFKSLLAPTYMIYYAPLPICATPFLLFHSVQRHSVTRVTPSLGLNRPWWGLRL